MAKYLLTCDCGTTLPVDVGQAGGKVVCACGRSVDVPTLRMLRHLPQAPEERAAPTSAWGVRKGTIAVFLILAAALGGFAAVNRLTEPRLPEFSPATQLSLVDQQLERMTPVQAWQLWVGQYRPLAEQGFTPMQSPHEPAIRAEIARRRFLRKVVLSLAGVCAALALVAAVWPAAKTRR
jgi:hypothetical protein